ncbi:ERF family protein [Thermoactinomyces daqus]|uniref:ERF family protein n=1 Tax=Thermoactinomyces daqus TaxID=1329516 RepID=A0A7W1XC63_9BACL|nr:ERF family protein [Thermoactinomyces daqus]MBA4543965.1 ERF family protein [Thermoactinomyces daqus]
MKFAENNTNILAAFVKFQGLVKNPPKNQTATIHTKNGGSYSYKYADLAHIADVIRQPMKESGLGWFQNAVRDENNKVIGIYTILVHESGEMIEFEPIPVKEDERNQTNTASQKQGSAITYARRYSLSLALGLAADEDSDAVPVQPVSDKQKQPKSQFKKLNRHEQQPSKQKDLAAWNQLAEENQEETKQQKGNGAQRRRFFAICGEKKITTKRQKAIVYAFTKKSSRADVTDEEFADINKFLSKDKNNSLSNATEIEIVRAVNEFKEKQATSSSQESDDNLEAGEPVETTSSRDQQIASDQEGNQDLGLDNERLDEEIHVEMEDGVDGNQLSATS